MLSGTIDLHLQLHALIVYIATAGSDAGRGHTVVVHQEKRPTPLITQDRAQPSSVALERPRFAAAATEDLLLGARRLRAAFLQTSQRFAGRDTILLRAGASEPTAILIRSGFAC